MNRVVTVHGAQVRDRRAADSGCETPADPATAHNTKGTVDIKTRWGKATDKDSMDSRAARAEANRRYVRETLARRQPRYARLVERAAEAVARDMAQRCPAA